VEQVEGVIKYRLDFTRGPALPTARLRELIGWQRILRRLGLVGRDPARYGGLAYGNLSLRQPDGSFIISASQTADRPHPGPTDYTCVTDWDFAANRLTATGPASPSSESLTHAALYDADPAIGCILHVHCPEIWQRGDALALPGTDPQVAYGTPAMAGEVGRLYREYGFAGHGVLVMGGHQDGILGFGRDPDDAGSRLMIMLRRALSSD
jgi:hypothetical protein